MAVETNNTELLGFLASQKASVVTKDIDGNTPLVDHHDSESSCNPKI
jgi:hypothetical protein